MPMFSVRARLSLLVALSLLGGMVGASVIQDAPLTSAEVTVFPADVTVHGATLGEWSARQWQWTLSFPVQINPGQDVTGASCGYGQTAPVFFVPRNFPPCRVPEGEVIFVPIVGTECSTVEPAPYHGESETELRSCAASEVDRYTGIVVRVDGEKVPNIDAYRTPSPLFVTILPENNALDVPSGITEAVADGYQLMLAPLPPGDHEIMAHVELTGGGRVSAHVGASPTRRPRNHGPC